MRDLNELVPLMETNLFDIKEVRGLSGDCIRRILNKLVSESTVYLECGVYCGLSFTSAMYGNILLKHAIAIDSWAEKFGKGIDPRKEFLAAVEKYYPKEVPFTLIEANHWDVKELPEKPDLFYYDGAHDEFSQQRALTHFGPMCAKEFTFCVDDWNRPVVRKGTLKGLAQFEIVDAWEKILAQTDTNDKQWWNGFAVFKLKQK